MTRNNLCIISISLIITVNFFINYLLHRFGYLTIFVFPSYCSWQVLNNPLTRHTNWKTLSYSGQTWHPDRPTWCPRVCRCSRCFRFRYCSCYCCCWGQPHQKPGHLPVPVTGLGAIHILRKYSMKFSSNFNVEFEILFDLTKKTPVFVKNLEVKLSFFL